MGTTLVIVELLIIGFEVLVWLSLLLWNLLGFGTVYQESSTQTCLAQWKEVLATAAIAAAYTLGIVFDRFIGHLSTLIQRCHTLKHRWHKKKSKPKPAASDDARAEERFYISQIVFPRSYEIFENTDRQKRLLRATGVNSFITATVLWAFYGLSGRSFVLGVSFIILGAASAWTWYRTHRMLKLKLAELCSAKREEDKLHANNRDFNPQQRSERKPGNR